MRAGRAARLVKLERRTSFTKEKVALVERTAIAQAANTALMPILTSLDAYPFVQADASWYASVGTVLVTTMGLNAAMPLVKGLVAKWASNAKQLRAGCKPGGGKLIQPDLDAVFEGGAFDMTARYAASLVTVFVCMALSAGLPLLYPIATLTFAMGYATDKYASPRFRVS